MLTQKLLITKNWKERHDAEKMGMSIPDAQQIRTKMLFWKSDVKRASIDEEGNIILVFDDDQYHEIEYEEKIWKELEKYFKKNEEK